MMERVWCRAPQPSLMKQNHRLNVNDNKTKVMELLPENNQVNIVVIQGHTFEKCITLHIWGPLSMVIMTGPSN